MPTPDGPPPTRIFAIGDPQTTTHKLFSILDSHQLLGDDGMLAPDVGLVSIGDHFDYAAPPEECRAEGGLFLRWLAEHPSNQIHIIAGNHDLCRVMELAPFTDESYQQAQRDARTLSEEEFLQKYPSLPSPGCALKDFLGFSASQRNLVQTLLLGGRLRLSLHAVTEAGHDALITHAAVTNREFLLLGSEEALAERLSHAGRVAKDAVAASADPSEHAVACLFARENGEPRFTQQSTLHHCPVVVDAHQTAMVRASALNRYLQEAIDVVRDDWSSGRVHTPLSLSPVHEMGFAGQEGGGLLYHRPANPARISRRPSVMTLTNGIQEKNIMKPVMPLQNGIQEVNSSEPTLSTPAECHERAGETDGNSWEFDAKMPRRFDPRTLPLGLLQICGHTGHSKCLTSLGDWVTPETKQRAIGGLRTLTTNGERVQYQTGVLAPIPEEATLYMIDIEIHKEQPAYELLPLRSVHP